jgi:hypothetical protein
MQHLAETEICQLEAGFLMLRFIQKILGLQVPMHDTMCVQVL